MGRREISAGLGGGCKLLNNWIISTCLWRESMVSPFLSVESMRLNGT